MSEPAEPVGLSKQRLEALTDGIFAVAMTLLVIELRLPEGTEWGHLGAALLELAPKFLSWIISFYVLAIFWFAHHRIFHHLRTVDSRLVRHNMLYLALVSLMPFSSALAGEFARSLISQVFYSANMLLLALLGLWQTRYVMRHPELWEHRMTEGYYRGTKIRTLGLVSVAVAAVVVGMVAPSFGNAAFILMAPISRIGARAERRRAA